MHQSRKKYVLWLPSWYPNSHDRFLGDFIQRHAEATALFVPLTVIHFVQLGPTKEVQAALESRCTGNLREVIVSIPFKPSGIAILDKVRYNLRFYKYARLQLKAFFLREGLPANVHVHIPVKAGNLALWIRKRFGISYIVSEHSSYYLPEVPNNFFQRPVRYRMQVKRILQKARLVINVSNAIGSIEARQFLLPTVKVIHNVVNTSLFHYQADKEHVFTFIHVSTFSHAKNIPCLLSGFERLLAHRQDWNLLMIGPATTQAIDLIRKFGLEGRVTLKGEVDYQTVACYMRRSHALVMFSAYENFPCVIVEALCCGLPVIATRVGGVEEAVDRSNGILVEKNDLQAFTEALLYMIDHQGEFDASSIAGKAQSLYNYQQIGQQIFNLYCSI